MTVTGRVTVIELAITWSAVARRMNGHSEWYAGGSQGMYSPDPAMHGPAPDAVYDAHRLFAAYPTASTTPSAHGTVFLLVLALR